MRDLAQKRSREREKFSLLGNLRNRIWPEADKGLRPMGYEAAGRALKMLPLWSINANLLVVLNYLMKPGSGKGPILFDRGNGDVEDFGRFLIGPASKITQFNNFGLDRMVSGELVQGLVYGQQFGVGCRSCQLTLIQVNTVKLAAVPASHSTAGGINHD